MLERLRALCLALPEAEERVTWEHETFRVRGKIFAMHVDGDLWCKAPAGTQALLVEADAERFFRPPYMGPKGWIGVRLGVRGDWEEVAALVARSWEMTVPAKLRLLRSRPVPHPAGAPEPPAPGRRRSRDGRRPRSTAPR